MGQRADDDPWSVTEKTLREQMRKIRADEREAAVATVADVEGSAYRRPGAKMIVPTDGTSYGAVTAGCLEDSVLEIARDVIDSDRPHLEVFDLMEDDEDTWGLGLGCNGIIDLFVEPVDAGWDLALSQPSDGRPVTIVTVVESDSVPAGSRTLFDDDGDHYSVEGREPVPEEILDSASDTIDAIHSSGKTHTVDISGTRLLVDSLQPVPRLLLFGSQNDLPPVVRQAQQVGFEVVIHSSRGGVDESTFPRADDVRTGHPTTIDDTVAADEYTYAVVMSHNLLDDQLALQTLLRDTEVPYVGLMGPRERFEELRDGLSESDVALTAAELDRVSTPVGLDLGGGEPVEIALSIVGEVLAVSNGRAGGRLDEQKGPIHPRHEEVTDET